MSGKAKSLSFVTVRYQGFLEVRGFALPVDYKSSNKVHW